MNKQAGIEFLRNQLASVESERKKLDAEEQAIRLLLAKHAGTERSESLPRPKTVYSYSFVNGGESISSLTVQALKEAGKPQRTEQLLAFLASHGKKTSSATLRSTIYMKKGKVFTVISPGLYSLVDGVS